MELVQLHYFRELAQREHLTQTAHFLNLTAPSLSISISRLEQELGVPLFDRVGRNIRLNENGRIFLTHVDEALHILETGKERLKFPDQVGANVLRIGISAQTLWLDAIKEFMGRFPYVSLFHSSIRLNHMQDRAYMERYDFAITALHDLPHPEWDYVVLVPDDKPLLVLSSNHPLSGRERIDLADLADEQFVALPKNFSSRKLFDDLCAAADLQPNIVAECDYLLRAEVLHTSKRIVSITTVLGMTSELLKGLECIPIVTTLPPRVQAIQWKKDRQLSPTALIFKDFLVEYYKTQIREETAR
jgi:DNA-binding transcriptional LysR family regulator